MDHLSALEFRLHNERMRLNNSKTDQEREIRQVWVDGIEKEIAAEYAFLGKDQPIYPEMTIDEIFSELDA